MNKFAVVLGVAAVVTLAGCKDTKVAKDRANEDKVKVVDTTPEQQTVDAQAQTSATTVVTTQAEPEKHCKCPPGTKHAEPCGCGASDCACVVVAKPVEPAPQKPAEPEYTVYIVQRGDYLAKISKKYNVTIASIKSLNNLKGDMIRIGQKLKLPGKIDVGAQTAPAPQTKPAKPAAAAPAKAYAGATKEYVVKNGDTLGAIAYGSGITIRQLKQLNGLESDMLKIGQKLKVPAEKQVKAKSAPAKTEKAAAKPAETVKAEKAEPKKAEPAPAQEKPVVEEVPAADAPAEVAEPAAEAKDEKAADSKVNTYQVQEGDDITGVAIRWGVTAAAIRDLNNLPEDAQLKPGQVLKLPADAQQ